MSNKYHHIAIALAGVCQNATLVPKLANTGQCNNQYYDIAIKSIFNQSPQTTEDVFGGADNIQAGLQFLTQLFVANQQEKMEVMRYIFGSIGIANKLLKNRESLDKIANRLARIQSLYDNNAHDSLESHRDEISYSLAGIYSDILSPLTSKIRVAGKVEYLQNTLVQAKVRTSLFGSVRSAILWHQVGGNRLQFIFARKNIINAAHDILR